MFRLLQNKYREKKKITDFFILTYADRGLAFALPLSVLFVLRDKELYAYVEVIFSYATLCMVVLELGISNYLFYGYKHAVEKEDFILKSQRHFKALLSFYLGITLLLGLATLLGNGEFILLAALTGIRSLFMLYTSFYSNVFRLKDVPSAIYRSTISVNLFSFVLLSLAYILDFPHKLFCFFLPPLALVLYTTGKFLLAERERGEFREFFVFFRRALVYSWPIIINVLAMSFIGNYAKIHAFGKLGTSEMVQVSYVLRMGLLVQLTHAAFASYFSKTLFMNQENALDVSIFRKYSVVLFLSTILLVILILVSNALFSALVYIPLSWSTVFFLLYIVCWCYIGYLELYFGVMNANRRVLYYSVISSLFYTALLKLGGDIDIFKLSLFMFLTGVLNLLLVVAGLGSLGVLKHRALKN